MRFLVLLALILQQSTKHVKGLATPLGKKTHPPFSHARSLSSYGRTIQTTINALRRNRSTGQLKGPNKICAQACTAYRKQTWMFGATEG
eukprot:770264-Pyramimonas_sp.AAC.1